MPPPPTIPGSALQNARIDNLLGYATTTASTLRDVAENSSTPFLRTISAVSLSILTIAQAVKTNRDECLRMVSQIDELLSVLLQICIQSKMDEAELAPATLYNIGKFADTLQKIHAFVELQQNTSLIKRFFRQSESTVLLTACRAGLSHAVEVFGVQTSLQASAEMAETRVRAEQRHQELVELFQSKHGTGAASTSLGNPLGSGLGDSSSSFLLIPASPKIFHGREVELEDIVSLLLQDPARVAILGPGGIGKTALCLAAIHHAEVATKYSQRYFVSCESATTLDALIGAIAGCVGLSLSGSSAKRLVRYLQGLPPCLVVLDNFESTWEPLRARSDVEDFLASFTDSPQVALLMTMRGAERPSSVRWTRPFLPPLEPLTDDAAEKIFLDITDERFEDGDIRELLGFTNNVPLAVNLVANIAAFEGYETLLLRWQSEKTQLFSDGPDKRSNLDLSIQISLSSPRMVDSPGAMQLLSLLSLLPDGILDADLLQSNLPVAELGRSRTTLVRTSLAYIAHDQRLRVLAPIREYIQHHHPPDPALCRPLRRHFHALICLWKDCQHLASAGIVQRISANAGNFAVVLRHGLDAEEPDLRETLDSALTFDSFSRILWRRPTGLLQLVPEFLAKINDPAIHARYLTEWIITWQYHPQGNFSALGEEAIEKYRLANDRPGEARVLCALGRQFHSHHNNLPKSLDCYRRALQVAREGNDPIHQCLALRDATNIEWQLGRYRKAQIMAQQIRSIAQLHGMFYYEAHGIRQELLCLVALGDFQPCAGLAAHARNLLAMCGLEDTILDLFLQNVVANMHFQRTEYEEAKAIYLRTFPLQAPLAQAYDRMSLCQIEVALGRLPTSELRANVADVRASFESQNNIPGLAFCDILRANINIRDGRIEEARSELQRIVDENRTIDQEIVVLALNQLADPACGWGDAWTMFGWALVLLAYALKGRSRLAIHHALRCIGDVLLAIGQEEDALSCFQAALDGFTAMGVHRSRGECALRIGDIHSRREQGPEAAAHWRVARECFLESCQDREVQEITLRLGRIECS